MQSLTMRWLIPLTLVVWLLPACSDTADDSADTTLASTTTTVQSTTATETTSAIVAATVEVTGSTGMCDLPGDVLTCQLETSDDRINGIAEISVHCELTNDGDTTLGDCSGPALITNADGTWEGACQGTTTWSTSAPSHVHDFVCTYLGTGSYAGLRYTEHLEGTDFPWPVNGRIEPTP